MPTLRGPASIERDALVPHKLLVGVGELRSGVLYAKSRPLELVHHRENLRLVTIARLRDRNMKARISDEAFCHGAAAGRPHALDLGEAPARCEACPAAPAPA